jgi:hypothetical protein
MREQHVMLKKYRRISKTLFNHAVKTKNRIFFMNNPVNTVSIGQILDFIIHVTKENHITEWTIFTSRKKIYDFLSERIFPETGQSKSFSLGDRQCHTHGREFRCAPFLPVMADVRSSCVPIPLPTSFPYGNIFQEYLF